MNSGLLTTGQAARLCSVTPDTVLKWIRAGRLRAKRTPGGHHRIDPTELEGLIHPNGTAESDRIARPLAAAAGAVRYCWEFNSSGLLSEGCRTCVVFQMRAHRCYEVIRLVPDGGHAQQHCEGSCEQCSYYQQVHQQATNVLVVTDNESLSTALKQESADAPFCLEITSCEYTTSALVERFRPDYVVIDCSLGTQQSRDISTHLLADPRIPYVKVIMATDDGDLPEGCDKEIFAHIRKPLGADDITGCIKGRDALGPGPGSASSQRGSTAEESESSKGVTAQGDVATAE